MLETYAGRGRVYSCYVKNESCDPTGARHATPGGYAVREWLAPQPQPHWDDVLVTAHRRWGRGRELAYTEVQDLLALILRLQTLATALEAQLEAQIPRAVRKRQAAWDARSPKMSLPPIALWASRFRQEPWLISHLVHDQDYVIFSNDSYTGARFTLRLPAA